MLIASLNSYSKLFITLPLVVSLIAGCSSSQNPSGDAPVESSSDIGVVEVEFWYALTGPLEQALLDQITDFHATHDDVRIVPINKGTYSETLQAGLDAISAGNPPPILQVYEVGTATMAKNTDAYISVDSLMQQYGTTAEPNYLPLITSYFSSASGELLSLPYNVSTPVLFLNTDALTQSGVDGTVSTRTWNDVEALLQTLKDQGRTCPFTTSWPSWIHLETYSSRHDLPFATAGNGFDSDVVALVFNGVEQISHVGRLRKWSEQNLFIYKGAQSAGGGPFREGECILLTESSASRAGTEALADFAFTVRPLPYDDINGAPQNTIIGGASLWALANQTSETYSAVAQFIEYLSSPMVQAAWHQRTGYLPITQASYELSRDQGYYDRVPDAEIPILQMSQGNPGINTRGIRLNNFVEIRTIIDEELGLAWSGGNKSAEQALSDALIRSSVFLEDAD